jgi:nucleotide-binding universal stress UspA family protein
MSGCIVVPLDGSRLSERALAPAKALARFTETELHCVRVALASQIIVFADMGGAVLYPDQALTEGRRESEAYLEAVRAAETAEDFAVRTEVRMGDVPGEVVDAARDARAQFIVMSSHGYSGVRRWLLGSVAETVLHAAPCPVWVVRAATPPRHMLIPLDGSPLAEEVLEPALAVARCFDTRVTLFRAVPELHGHDLARLEGMEPGLGRRYVDNLAQAATDYLERVALSLGGEPARVRTKVGYGPPAEAILDHSERNAVDLVAMTTHGLTGLRRWVYGSVMQKVLDQLPVSMLVARSHAADFA